MALSSLEPTPIQTLFPKNYHQSRERFRKSLERIREQWPTASLETSVLFDDEDLSVDWIYSDSNKRLERLLIVTTAEHGIEGYVGAAILHRLIEHHCPHLDPSLTGILLVHAINPWGMAHFRRTNSQNIDLNRNFVRKPGALDPSLNPDFELIQGLLSPEGPARTGARPHLRFLVGLISALRNLGLERFRNALLSGQYTHKQGIFYGGKDIQPETQWYQGVFDESIQAYKQVVHLDMHTGYGPRYQMSLVNSSLEPRGSKTLERHFGYPLVVSSTPNEFYAMNGDLIDYEYRIVGKERPDCRFYATSFEFGTLGDSLWATIQSIWTKVLENQAAWYGAASDKERVQIQELFRELYYPNEEKWRIKAVQDADHAIRGILKGEGFWVENKIAGT